MKIYVASSWRNQWGQQAVVQVLKNLGHDVYDFRKPSPLVPGFSWSEIDRAWRYWDAQSYIGALHHPAAQRGFDMDMEALRDCDLCILVLPCGRSAHLELGWAAGKGKYTAVLIGNEPFEAELMYKMCDRVCASFDDMLNFVDEVKAKLEPKPFKNSRIDPCDDPDFKEPWTYNGSDKNYLVMDRTGFVHASTEERGYSNADERIAKRIVACVNHCVSLPTSLLERMLPASIMTLWYLDSSKVLGAAVTLMENMVTFLEEKSRWGCRGGGNCWCTNACFIDNEPKYSLCKLGNDILKGIKEWKDMQAKLTEESAPIALTKVPIIIDEQSNFAPPESPDAFYVPEMPNVKFTQAEAIAIQQALSAVQRLSVADQMLKQSKPIFNLGSDEVIGYEIDAATYSEYLKNAKA